MQFLVHWTISEDHRDAAQARFKETGAPPPAGVTMHGRWHSVAGREGMLVCETDDQVAMGVWLQQWSDVLTFRVIPVADDQQMVKIMS